MLTKICCSAWAIVPSHPTVNTGATLNNETRAQYAEQLVRIDAASGNATWIGTPGLKIASIAFVPEPGDALGMGATLLALLAAARRLRGRA